MKSKFLAVLMVAVAVVLAVARPAQAQESIVDRVAALEKKLASMDTMHAAIMAKLDKLSAKIDAVPGCVCAPEVKLRPTPSAQPSPTFAYPAAEAGGNCAGGQCGIFQGNIRGRFAARRGR